MAAQFEYTGQLGGGSAISGVIESESIEAARGQLEEMGVLVTSLAAGRRQPPRRALSAEDFRFFNEQLASLAKVEGALEPGLRRLAADVVSRRLKRTLTEVADDLARGTPLDQAVARRGPVFPPLYVQVIQAGIRSGALAATLYNLNAHFRLLAQARRLVWEAAGYPLIVFAFAFVLVTYFFLGVVPEMESIMVDFGVAAPLVTELCLRLAAWWPAIAVGLLSATTAGVVLFQMMRRSPSGRRLRERLLLRLPVVAPLYRASTLARFTRAAALSAAAGQPLPLMLRLAAGAGGSALLVDEAERCAAAVEAGGSIAEATLSTRMIPALFGYAVEQAGARDTLPAALEELAQAYDDQAQQRVVFIRVMLAPVMIVLLGLSVGFLILALFLPTVSLLTSLTGS